jgi:peptidoglycan/LPS O-acetylase OafA/YrhL
LRAVAVYLVVAFHAGLARARGGFIGVDVFFVLSGYLVTRILLDDLTSEGRIGAKRFYARRARRVLPAALVTLVVTAVAYALVATPAERFQIVDGVRAAFVYLANWLFVHQSTDYFAPSVTSSPVLHFWSLAVEEQFYLLWPLLLGGLWVATRRAGTRQIVALRSVVVVAAVASAGAALTIGATNLERAYYGTDTRAYQLLAGAALALTPQLFASARLAGRVARWGSAAAMVALFVLASSAFAMSPISRGVFVAAVAVVLIVTLEQAHGGLVARALSWEPVAYLGRISYGVYLWHWPVIVIALHGRNISAPKLFVISVVLSTALAAISYRLLEQPIRTSRALDRYRVPVVAVGLAASLVCGVVVAPVILEPGNTSVSASGVNGPSATKLRLLDWRVALEDIPPLPNCTGRAVFKCTLEHGSGTRVLLIGDSVARAWIPTFRGIAKQRSWKFSVATRPVCPWQRGLQNFLTPALRAVCRGHQEDWYEHVIPKLDPEIIILAHQAYDDPGFPVSFFDSDDSGVLADSPRLESVLDDASDASLQVLRGSGRQVVILEPLPVAPPPFDPLNCLSKGGDSSQCTYRANRGPTPLERHYRSYADDHDRVVSVDADRLVCPRLPICDPVIGRIIVKRDPTHLTATFARSLVDPMDALLRRSGVSR